MNLSIHLSRRLCIPGLLLAASGLLSGQTTDTSQSAPPKSQTDTPAAHAPKSRIYAGMPAAELRALIGKPDKVVPVPTKSGQTDQVEIWIYRRLINSSTEIVTVGNKPIMGRRLNGDGTSTEYVMTTEPVNKNRVTETYKVASFLIANGQYITTTQTEEKQQYFQ